MHNQLLHISPHLRRRLGRLLLVYGLLLDGLTLSIVSSNDRKGFISLAGRVFVVLVIMDDFMLVVVLIAVMLHLIPAVVEGETAAQDVEEPEPVDFFVD